MDWAPVGEIDFSDSPVLCQAWSNQSLAVGREDGSVTIFDTEKVFDNFFVPMTELYYTKAVQSLAFGASGRFLAVGGDCGLSSILDSNGGWLSCHELNFDKGTRLLATSWSPDDRYLIVAGTNKVCRVIDTITWTDLVQVEAVTNKLFDNDSAFSAIANVDWSLDGEWIALGTIGGGIYALGTTMWHLLVPSKDRLSLSPVEEREEVADTAARGQCDIG
jgi:WD40 repeat protein